MSTPSPAIVITGGAGFIGSHLVEHFLRDNKRVVAIDNLLTGALKNINQARQHPNFQFIEADAAEGISLPKDSFVSAVLHFASPASPVDYLRHPLATLKVGSFGTYHALELARLHGARFLLASTSEVYGDPLVHPQPESYFGNVNPIGPRSVYDEAKRFSEALTMAYHRVHGLNSKIVRIFNTYGPRMRLNDGRAIPNFFYQALSRKDLTVYGDGQQTRSFCYISDLIEGIVRVLASDLHEPIKLGNPVEMTILDLAEAVNRLVGNQNKIVFQELPLNDPKVRRPDITQARNMLGWEPRVSFEEGIRMTAEFFFRKEIS